MQAYLHVTDAKGERQVPLALGPLTIGRNFTNLLVLHESLASRYHCVIINADDGITLRDLQSRNGTLVNGQLIREAALFNGDVVTIGKTEIKLIVETKPT